MYSWTEPGVKLGLGMRLGFIGLRSDGWWMNDKLIDGRWTRIGDGLMMGGWLY